MTTKKGEKTTFQNHIELCEELTKNKKNANDIFGSSRAKQLAAIYHSSTDPDLRQHLASDVFREFNFWMKP